MLLPGRSSELFLRKRSARAVAGPMAARAWSGLWRRQFFLCPERNRRTWTHPEHGVLRCNQIRFRPRAPAGTSGRWIDCPWSFSSRRSGRAT